MTHKQTNAIGCLLLCLFFQAQSTMADNGVDPSALEKIYQEVKNTTGVEISRVQYSGDFSSEISGFEWQAGDGRGTTTGERLMVKNPDSGKVKRYYKTFRSYKAETHVILDEEKMRAAVGLNDLQLFYGMRMGDDGELYFLKARTDDCLCVVKDWDKRDHYKGPQPKPDHWAAIDEETKRLLGVSHLWMGIRRNFAFMERVKLDWDSLYAATVSEMKAAKDNGEAVKVLQKMAAAVGNGHTYVYAYGNVEREQPAPFTTRLIDGKVYVDQVESTALKAKGVRRGLQVVTIDSMDVSDYARQRLAPYVSASTEQWRLHQMFDNHALTMRTRGDTIRIGFSDGRKTFVLPYETGSLKADRTEIADNIAFAKYGDIGYLRISSFMDSSIPKTFDKIYAQLLDTKALVIDIRNNGGGNSGNADYVLRHFSRDSIRTNSWKSRKYIPAFASWGYKEGWYEQPGGHMSPVSDKEPYLKPVAVLADKGTFSAAEDFIGVMRGMRTGTLVGEPTGGSTGNGVRLDVIPGACAANICAKHDTASDGTDFDGVGFQPDIPATETYQSYFKDRQDNCLRTAIRHLKQQLELRSKSAGAAGRAPE